VQPDALMIWPVAKRRPHLRAVRQRLSDLPFLLGKRQDDIRLAVVDKKGNLPRPAQAAESRPPKVAAKERAPGTGVDRRTGRWFTMKPGAVVFAA
jgi:hypothetical protein